MTLVIAYDNNKWVITTKTDVGTMQYATSGKPYAISTISENNYNAAFTYGIDNQRAKMVVQQGSNHLETRWYPGVTVMKDSLSGTEKTYTYIGGDAYSALCVNRSPGQ